MNAWLAVCKKDFRMVAPWLLTGLLIILSIDLIALLTVENTEAKMALIVAPMFVHILYFPVFLSSSLERESKQMHLWLHSPRPAWQLLLSKIVNACIATALSLGFSLVVPVGLIWTYPTRMQEITMADMDSLVDAAVSIFIASLSLGFLFLLLWTIQQSLKGWIGKWSGVIYVAILFNNPLMGLKTHVSSDGAYVEFKVSELGPWADGVLSFTLMFLFFLLSAWLLDKKTEV
ncbi:ABC-type transport system involved in multi-copper enzyme maturation permease subunit [Kroppenstedtia sanguinis]|uniref:hypothetical protein n=1 Tax=Kroppenstedtia sanguinis TaxID=1380684 RepID=UPI003D19789D